ncbi:CC0125/CC1285 family lipoprotein [Parvularcula lutaonensis]|uniref:DUF4136 domain-containing protein n=1 Tax=Parvularcula lutaonensis TaxID=491923 RepID=A0ABV7MAB8_9PROT|nr:hypothetical protein [Parvularcula lutaonensis]
MKQIVSALALVMVAACAGTPDYGPANARGFGYAEQQIETGRYRVSYKARNAVEAEDGALRRAAELTRMRGFDYFTVVSRDVSRERSGGGSSIGIGGATGGRRSGVGVGLSVPLGGGSEEVTTRLEIVMGKGSKPDDPRAYDANAVLGNLGTL